MDTILKWSFGNSKIEATGKAMGLKSASFGLPAYASADGFRVCPGAAQCIRACYARDGRYQMPIVKERQEHNLAAARECDTGPKARFTFHVWSDLTKIFPDGNGLVRVHDSGDFFSQAYLDAWKLTAAKFPGIQFYAYTKSLHLDLWSDLPSNFSIVQSFGGIHDNLIRQERPIAKIFTDETGALKWARTYGLAHHDDIPAVRGAWRVGLVVHGRKATSKALLPVLLKNGFVTR